MSQTTIDFEPKYITFDCYGTLTDFNMSRMARAVYADRLPDAAAMDCFVHLFSGYRFDEVMGPYKPYRDVILNALRRACDRTPGVSYSPAEADAFYAAIPTWGPHADVPEGLRRLARKYKLVVLSNAAEEQIARNVEKLGAPFHAVFTAERVGSYKPRMAGFEHMFEALGCGPEDVLHVSSSLRYDLMTAEAMGVRHKVFVKGRGHEPSTPAYNYYEVEDIGELATMLGL